MKRMTAKQIEFEAGRIFGALWKQREKSDDPLSKQLQDAIDKSELPKQKLQMAQYLIECAGDLN